MPTATVPYRITAEGVRDLERPRAKRDREADGSRPVSATDDGKRVHLQ